MTMFSHDYRRIKFTESKYDCHTHDWSIGQNYYVHT